MTDGQRKKPEPTFPRCYCSIRDRKREETRTVLLRPPARMALFLSDIHYKPTVLSNTTKIKDKHISIKGLLCKIS